MIHDIPIEYFRFLSMYCGIDFSQYFMLVSYLYSRDYYYILEIDENLAVDAWGYRDAFIMDNDLSPGEAPWNGTYSRSEKFTSVLEVLIVLADRCDYTMYDWNNGHDVDRWFYILLDNLGLSRFTDDNWTNDSEIQIAQIIDIWLDRIFDQSTAVGSPFPLKNPRATDLRTVDFWSLGQFWLDER